MDRRYAIYIAPPGDSALARWGAAWLGRDAELERPVASPGLPGWSDSDLDRVTAAPRIYGLHATLKPPFRLALGVDEAALLAAIEALARARTPPPAVRLCLAEIEAFVALVPADAAPDLYRLADDCVAGLDRFRAPPGAAELARRRVATLSQRQREHLARWGYPYVFDTFRFHITLSGGLADAERTRLRQNLAPDLAPVLQEPLRLDDLAVFIQDDGGPFRLAHRFRFGHPPGFA